MASPLKQLAGETAIYGLSTILARVINFLFVPFYTRLLTPESYGVVTEFLAYIAVLQVVLVLGLETGCFRFANKEGVNSSKVYSNAFWAVLGLNAAFFAVLLAFAEPLSALMGYVGHAQCLIYMGGILLLDSVTAILFAKLRQEHKPLKFAILKTAKILSETGANLYLFLAPQKPEWIYHFVSRTPDFSYVIFAIFVSCVVCALLFLPNFAKMSLRLDGKLLRQMLLYSLPLMIAALPGIFNDFLDRILFRFLDNNPEGWRASLGIFQASVKLAVIMNLFIQMFRFAAEPFFFQRAADKNSPQLYARVMNWFVAFCGLIFLGVMLYMDFISLILGRDFRAGLGIVPIMLLSYMILGMNFNVSMWYKLSGKTSMAIWITLSGLLITALVNVLFMPRFSYWASAYGHLASYLAMFIISAALGAKYYPIPYNWRKIALFFVVMGGCFALSQWMDNAWFPQAESLSFNGAFWTKTGLHTILLALYAATCYFILKDKTLKQP